MTHAIRKAVIPMAGLGTRFRPVTHVVPKEFLPIGNKPLFHYIVEEVMAAGCEELVCVVQPGSEMPLRYVEATGLDIRITLRHQKEAKGLGHAIACAKDAVGDEAFLVLLPDDVMVAGSPSVSEQLCTCYAAESGCGVIAVRPEPEEMLDRYGIVSPLKQHGSVITIKELVEKPAPGTAPSNLAILGRYLLPGSIFSILEDTPPGAKGEIQLTDALQTLAKRDTLLALTYEDVTMFDAGTPPGWHAANEFVARN